MCPRALERAYIFDLAEKKHDRQTEPAAHLLSLPRETNARKPIRPPPQTPPQRSSGPSRKSPPTRASQHKRDRRTPQSYLVHKKKQVSIPFVRRQAKRHHRPTYRNTRRHISRPRQDESLELDVPAATICLRGSSLLQIMSLQNALQDGNGVCRRRFIPGTALQTRKKKKKSSLD